MYVKQLINIINYISPLEANSVFKIELHKRPRGVLALYTIFNTLQGPSLSSSSAAITDATHLHNTMLSRTIIIYYVKRYIMYGSQRLIRHQFRFR